MWRQNHFQGNCDFDSDQSISDDEDFSSDLRYDCVPYGGRAEKSRDEEEGLQLQSKLERLKGINEHSFGRKTSDSSLLEWKDASYSLEDDVQVPDSPREAEFVSSKKTFPQSIDEEAISDDEDNNVLSKFSVAPRAETVHRIQGIGEQDVACRWSIVTKEAETLIHMNKISHLTHFSSYKDQSSRGTKSKAKPRFSFGLQSHEKRASRTSTLKDENDLSIVIHEDVENTMDQLNEHPHGHRNKQLVLVADEVESSGRGFYEHSVAELLDGLQENTGLPRRNPKISCKRRKRVQLSVKKDIRSDALPEPIIGDSSSNDEADYQNCKLAIPETKKTMSDRFQEALGTTSLSNEGVLAAAPKPLGSGLFGRLQQVIQQEKEKDLSFLKKLQNGTIIDEEPNCISVKIASKYLDAKLTVCHCSLVKTLEDIHSQHRTPKLESEEKMVIFNQRICGDVDLEVGNCIQIYPPWKEVQAMCNAQKIILSTYFSQISQKEV